MVRVSGLVIGAVCVVSLAGCVDVKTNLSSGSDSDSAAPAKSQPASPSAATTARRNVKVGLDSDAAKINLSPKETTVEDLVKNHPTGDVGTRQSPFETTTWKLDATIDSVQIKRDGDYYMVLKGDNGGETVVEVPDPATAKGSPLANDIASARKEIEDRYHPTKEIKHIGEKATITGVGFLGWGTQRKNATGFAGSRLMPGLGFDFKKKKS